MKYLKPVLVVLTVGMCTSASCLNANIRNEMEEFEKRFDKEFNKRKEKFFRNNLSSQKFPIENFDFKILSSSISWGIKKFGSEENFFDEMIDLANVAKHHPEFNDYFINNCVDLTNPLVQSDQVAEAIFEKTLRVLFETSLYLRKVRGKGLFENCRMEKMMDVVLKNISEPCHS